jgi:hypothetical protein
MVSPGGGDAEAGVREAVAAFIDDAAGRGKPVSSAGEGGEEIPDNPLVLDR